MSKRWPAVDALVLSALVLWSSIPVAGASPAPPKPRTGPDMRSNAFYVLDETDSKVLAARKERVAVPIASITKLMTALVVLKQMLVLEGAGAKFDRVVDLDELDRTPGGIAPDRVF